MKVKGKEADQEQHDGEELRVKDEICVMGRGEVHGQRRKGMEQVHSGLMRLNGSSRRQRE